MSTNDKPPLSYRIDDYILNAIKRLMDEQDAFIEACIFGDRGNPGNPEPIVYWRIGRHSGHEPTRELARAAVLRVSGVKERIG